jgi:glycosyltransferase involved in cell wall biosynthesis
MPNCTIILPVYNEKEYILEALTRLWSLSQKFPLEIIVVESSSDDGSREIVETFSKVHAIKLILQDEPLGKGHAVIEGLGHVTSPIVAILDGDLEYDVNDLIQLLKPIEDNLADFVLGSRYINGKPMRNFTNHRILSYYFNIGHKVFTAIFNLLYGTRLKDPATMWKIFKIADIQGITLTGQRFEFDWEILSVICARKKRIIEIPVYYKSRSKEDGKKIKPISDPIRWLYWIFIYRIRFSRV